MKELQNISSANLKIFFPFLKLSNYNQNDVRIRGVRMDAC